MAPHRRPQSFGASLRHGLLLIVALFALLPSGSFAGAPRDPSPDSLLEQGARAFKRGSFEQALAAWKRAAEVYDAYGNPKGQSRALLYAAQASHAIGQLRPALQQLELALSLAQKSDDAGGVAAISESLGRVYLTNRQTDAAAHYFNAALDLARRINHRALAAAVLNDIGILRAAQGKYQDALAAYREGISLADETKQESLAVHARINAARAARQLQQPEDADASLDEAARALAGFGPSHDKAMALINLGPIDADLRPALSERNEALLLRAADAFKEAAAVADSIGDVRTASYAWGHLGRLYETEHRYEEALALTRRAVFAAQSATAPESLYRWQWQAGRILASLGKLDEALMSYRSAVETLEPIRPEVALAAQNPASTAPDSIRPLYFEYADLLLHRAARTEEGEAEQGYLKAARDAVEASKAAELRDYFRDECVDALQSHITRLDTISATTAVVYPVIFANRTELLVSLPQGLKRVGVPVSSKTLIQEVRALRRMLEKRTTREYLPHAQRLYDWLVRPFERDFAAAKVDTLVFVPDGPLRTIPMAALHDGNRFLVARYAVATSPGIDLTDPQPLRREKMNVLASGLTEAVQGFPPLPYVSLELETIHTLYGGDQLVNRNFLTRDLEKELKEHPISVLHIASHGRFEKEVSRSFILTFDDKLTMERLDQYVGLFRFRQKPLELLTLSACETAVGDDRAALGLAGVAIRAGARSALATLWSINDQASSSLVGILSTAPRSVDLQGGRPAAGTIDVAGRRGIRPSGVLVAVPLAEQLALRGMP